MNVDPISEENTRILKKLEAVINEDEAKSWNPWLSALWSAICSIEKSDPMNTFEDFESRILQAIAMTKDQWRELDDK